MNLALHGFLLQVIASLVDFQHGFRLCSAGEPGYLDFDNLPETNFSCQGKVIGGYYADVETGCQMFHVCTIGQKDEIMDIKFLCLNGTVFDQETRVCERVDEVDCSKSERFYNLNLELYGNNAVTLSLHDNNDDDGEPTEAIDDHQQRTTSARPSTTTTTTTTTTKPPTTPVSYQHPTGYPHHFQPQPPFPTSQSKLHYDDKNGGFHHQYIFHNGERPNTNQATSYQLFSNQGIGSTTGASPQIHQIRYSSTPNPQIIHNEPPTIAPIFRASSSTIQTLLNSNANNPALINPLFHNHGIASTTEQFSVHSNNPRETSEYQDEDEDVDDNDDVENDEEENDDRIPLEAIQPTNKGIVSKLTIAPIPPQHSAHQNSPTKSTEDSQQQKISNFQPTPTPIEPTVRSFYPTPRTSPKPQSTPVRVPQHIHVPPPPSIPQLKPHQITINLPPPDIQRIVQNPSPLLPSQSRVIVTAKASVSDESGRPLNTTQLVTLPLPTIPASYDDYKEGDESFDPFYRDVPKIRNARRVYEHLGAYVLGASLSRRDNFVRSKREATEDYDDYEYDVENRDKSSRNLEPEDPVDEAFLDDTTEITDIEAIKANLKKFKAILLGRRMFTDSAGKRSRNLSLESDVSSSRVQSSKDVGSKMVDDADEQFDDDDDDDDDGDGAFETNTKANESEATSVTKASDAEVKSNLSTERIDVEESVDRKVALNDKELDAVKDSKSKSTFNTEESNAEDDLETKSTRAYVPEDTGRKSALNTNISDFEEYIESKSQLHSKESDVEEYVEPEFVKKVAKLDAEEFVKSKSVLDSKESDAEEYVESNPVLNSKESDAEEYVEIKSALKTERSDAEEQVELEPAPNNEESDAEEYFENKSPSSSENTNVEEHITVKYISSVKMSNTVVNRKMESIDKKIDDKAINPKSLNTKESDAEENIERKSSTNNKKSDLDEYIDSQSTLNTKDLSTEPNFISNTKKSDAEEYIKIESSLDDKESDVDELLELKFSTSTEGSDAEERVEFKSILNTKTSDAEEYIGPKSTSNENKSNADAEERTQRKYIPNTKISDIVGNVEPKSTQNTKSTDVTDDAEVKSALDSGEPDVTEYTKPKSASNTKDSETEEHTKIDKSIIKTEDTEKNVELESEKESDDDEDGTEDEENYADRVTGKTVSKNVEETRNEENEETGSKKSEATGKMDSRNVKGVTKVSKKVEEAKTSDSHSRPGAPKLKYPTRRPLLVSPTSRKIESAKDEGRKTNRTQSKSKVANESTNSLNSEAEEQIDSQIFEEPESQTSKEVDTRAVAQYESKVSKSLSKSDVDGKEGKNNLIKTSKMRPSIQGSKKERLFEEKPKSKEKVSKKDEVEDLVDDDEVLTTKKEKLEASAEEVVLSNEGDYVSEENASNDDESQQYSEEYPEDKSNESPNKIASDEMRKSSREKSEKEEEATSSIEDPSHREGKSMTFANEEDEDYEEEYGSQESSSSPKTSEEADSVEYSNTNDASLVDSREIDSDYDYANSQSREDATTSTEYVGSEEEVTNSQEESFVENDEPMPSDENDKTDVLKFTDELPSTEKMEDPSNEKKVESGKDVMQDYVDDNYEPVHYKEDKKQKEKEKEVEKEKKLTSSLDLDDKIVEDKVDDYVNDNDEPAHYKEKQMKETKKPFSSKDLKDENKEESRELELPEEKKRNKTKEENKKESTDELKSVEEERREDNDEGVGESTSEEGDAKIDGSFEEEDEDSTTTSTTTTTLRPTPPKLFKPISARKSYNFIPPTSTPNPVVIKPRLGLFNPKPSKPQKTYNDMAPKPTIRKHPLLARKTFATTGTTTDKNEQAQKRLDDIENSSEIVHVSTETGRSEENVLDSKTKFTDQKKSSVDPFADTQPLETAPLLKSKDNQILSANVEDVPSTSTESDEVSTINVETIIANTPYPSSKASKASPITRDPEQDRKLGINIIPSTKKLSTTAGIVSSTIETTTNLEIMTTKPIEISISNRPETTLLPPEPGPDLSQHSSTINSKLEGTTEMNSSESGTVSPPELTSARWTGRKSTPTKRQATFNCLEKEMYRFYGDTRDCRLFHYCSPGFTSRQVLDFRFVCEEGTVFDEESQSCRHDVKSTKCVNRPW